MEFRQGSVNMRKRNYNKAVLMWADYTHPINPLTAEQIAHKYKKSNGKPYTRQSVYLIFKRNGFTK